MELYRELQFASVWLSGVCFVQKLIPGEKYLQLEMFYFMIELF